MNDNQMPDEDDSSNETPRKPDSTHSYESYEEEVVTEDGVGDYMTEEVVLDDEIVEEVVDDRQTAQDLPAGGAAGATATTYRGGGSQVAPAPPMYDDDNYMMEPNTTSPTPKELQQRMAKVNETSEDRCLSSTTGLVTIGILMFLAVAAICIGTGLGVAKPWEEPPAVVIPKNISTPTSAPSVIRVFPTFSPAEPSPEDEELIGLWETVVGNVISQPGTPYYEAAQWMLYRDPSRVSTGNDEADDEIVAEDPEEVEEERDGDERVLRRLRRSNGRGRLPQRSLQTEQGIPTTVVYTDEEQDYIQRFLLVFLYFASTNNGQVEWESCNPIKPDYTTEDCVYQKAIRKLPDGTIQYQPIPWKRWLSGADECNWAGITCSTNEQGRLVITGIDLGGQGLEAPVEYIIELLKLPAIESLRFPWNTIRGTLLPEMNILKELDLTDNFVQGPLVGLSGLTKLILEGNYLTGSIPVDLFAFDTPLEFLNVGRNLLVGGVPVEASFALQLTSLQAQENKLNGSIPPEIGQLPLRSLKLNGNFLQGPLPIDEVNVLWLSSLEELWLNDNLLSGGIPSVLGTASRLLDLRLGGNSLTGTIPTEMYNLDRLYRLELASNALTGSIGIALTSQLTDLEVLDVSSNELSGRILFDDRLIKLQTLKVEFNQFSGDVPTDLCGIESLVTLTADCLPITSPPNGCDCCTVCCDTDTRTCIGANGSPVAAPTKAPLPAPIPDLTQSPIARPVSSPPVESPVEAPVSSAPVKSPSRSPAAAPVTSSPVTSSPVSTPVTSTPVSSPTRSPVSAPVVSPVVSPVRAPTVAPVQTPVTSPVTSPVTRPNTSPVSTTVAAVQSWARQIFGNSIDQSDGEPHSLASIWITSADTLGVVPRDATFLQRYTLAHFYFSTRTWSSCNPSTSNTCLFPKLIVGDDGSLSYEQIAETRFLASVSECEWAGIQCSSTGNVTGIALPGLEMMGTLPAELSVLKLTDINLAYNSLVGGIPEEYALLTGLKSFSVHGNSLSGTMPDSLCDLSSLTTLQADCDELTCTCCSQCY